MTETATRDPVSQAMYYGIPDKAAILARDPSGEDPRNLAAELLSPLSGQQELAMLRLLAEHKMQSATIAVTCLLDETAEASYQTASQMAELLCAEIERQGLAGVALIELVEEEIVAHSQLSEPAMRAIFLPRAGLPGLPQ